jgi:cobalt-zinc-cadmium efflux system protein
MAHGHASGAAHEHDEAPGHGAAHTHGPSRDADLRFLVAALTLLLVFLVAEVVAGILSHSLALLTDAGHLVTDAGALALAVVALRLAARPATGAFTYGLKRAEILSAQANGVTLAVLVVVFTYEAVRRLLDPPDVAGGLVTVTAAVGIGVNVAATWLVGRADRRSLNVEGAYLHLLTDLFAFAATLVAGLVVTLTGFDRADPIASLVVAALMAVASYRLLRDSGRVFLEASPRGIDPRAVHDSIAGLPGVTEVHELHVWEVTSGFPALSAHVLVEADKDCHERRLAVEERLRRGFGIEHTTLQVDHQEEFFPADSLRRRIDGGPGQHAGH